VCCFPFECQSPWVRGGVLPNEKEGWGVEGESSFDEEWGDKGESDVLYRLGCNMVSLGEIWGLDGELFW